MIRFLSISKAASGCILTLTQGTISIGTQTRPHHSKVERDAEGLRLWIEGFNFLEL